MAFLAHILEPNLSPIYLRYKVRQVALHALIISPSILKKKSISFEQENKKSTKVPIL